MKEYVPQWALPLLLMVYLLACGCDTIKPLKPGKSAFRSIGGATNSLTQPENPAAVSKQNYDRTEEKLSTIPAGTKIEQITETPQANTNLPPIVVRRIFTLQEPLIESTKTAERNGAEIGAAHEDTAREIGAKLASMRPVRIMGAILLLAALAMFHPVIKAITMSTTLQMVCGGAGIALMFLPSIIVGHEGIIIAAGILIPCIWWFAHRHGHMRATVDSIEEEAAKEPEKEPPKL